MNSVNSLFLINISFNEEKIDLLVTAFSLLLQLFESIDSESENYESDVDVSFDELSEPSEIDLNKIEADNSEI